MADCKIVNQNVKASVQNIQTIAGKYKTAGETLDTEFKAAISEMEGDAKDALLELFNKSYKSYVADGAVVIDVGINVDEEGNLCGDVNFDDVAEAASICTPVPGGVGSVTTSVLAKHLLKAAKARRA